MQEAILGWAAGPPLQACVCVCVCVCVLRYLCYAQTGDRITQKPTWAVGGCEGWTGGEDERRERKMVPFFWSFTLKSRWAVKSIQFKDKVTKQLPQRATEPSRRAVQSTGLFQTMGEARRNKTTGDGSHWGLWELHMGHIWCSTLTELSSLTKTFFSFLVVTNPFVFSGQHVWLFAKADADMQFWQFWYVITLFQECRVCFNSEVEKAKRLLLPTPTDFHLGVKSSPLKQKV